MKILQIIGGLALATLLVLTGIFAFNKDFRISVLESWGIVYNIDEETPNEEIETPEDETGDENGEGETTDPDLNTEILPKE